MRRAADGTGEPAVLVESANALNAPDWSRDDRFMLYVELIRETRNDIRYIEFGTDGVPGEPVTFLGSPANEVSPKLSPDGKWQASVNGGGNPRWSKDGKELYYVEGGTLMAVPVSTESAFALGRPQPLFETPAPTVTGGESGYDVSADGRFLTIAPVEDAAEAAPPAIRIVQNWYEEFRDRQEGSRP
jgi:Tol biopolymer transport system component